MTEEQKKVRKFYKELQGWKADSIGTWIGAGFLVMFMLIGCAIPVQEMLTEISGNVDMLGWIMVLMFGPLAGFLYLRPYTIITEMVYTNQAKNVRIIDKLKYLPIDLKEIRKMKVIYLLKFYAKIAPFCMLLQALTSLYSYQEITWVNVVYVLVMAFVWPVTINLPMILSESAVDISINQTIARYWKWIVVVLIFAFVAIYLFFPRNVKDLFLDGMDEDWLFFYSEDIISINGQQYCIYGEGMAEEFKKIIEEK